MAKKRPSLRNYLVEGDQARDIQPIEEPTPVEPLLSVSEILGLCPTSSLDLPLWAMAVASLLFGIEEGSCDLPRLEKAFSSVSHEALSETMDRALSSQILKVGDDGVISLNSPSCWVSLEDSSPSWSDELVENMVTEDREIWFSLISGASLVPLSLDSIKDVFEGADRVSDQFFMMRKAGDRLIPVTRQSQIRLPLEAVLKWSEQGNLVVFWGD